MSDASLLVLGAIVAFAMLWATGANDVANALGTSVGSKALTFRTAIIVGAIFELAGASLVGGSVEATIQKNLLSSSDFGDNRKFAIGMFSSIIGTFAWVTLATIVAIPVSTTHAIVGSVIGFAIFQGKTQALQGPYIGATAASWIVSPLLGALIAGMLYTLLRRVILRPETRLRRAELALPYLFAINIATDAVFVVVGGPELLHPAWNNGKAVYQVYLPVFVTAGILGFVAGKSALLPWVRRHRGSYEAALLDMEDLNVSMDLGGGRIDTIPLMTGHDKSDDNDENDRDGGRAAPLEASAESDKSTTSKDASLTTSSEAAAVEVTDAHFGPCEVFFAPLVVTSACAVAFAHGGNDVANALGPLGVIINYQRNDLATILPMPAYVNVIGGVAIVTGLATYGQKVMRTVGGGITQLSFSKAFSAQFGASVSILTATVIGLPISTTAVLVGCITGVGLTDGWRSDSVDFKLIGKIVMAWIITLPAAGITSGLIYLMLRHAW
eukprot:TRINITY_DN24355_c0_g1_i1.p1 TRINITY_DN24355_c0_g1~~TRINITY_DN24355_c0_g1_i1.p1  ORF type:complete len:498 (+),score=87.66 TRINITY_DN24355_c0_g1_i1:88-1581(+)